MHDDQSIAHLHGLDQHDPWQTEAHRQRSMMAERWRQFVDDGEQNDVVVPSGTFIDPPDDERLLICERRATFWRITVAAHRLSGVLSVAPLLEKQVVAMRNNQAGCWLAFTSRRIAQKIVQHLREHGVCGLLEACNWHGNVIELGEVQPLPPEWQPAIEATRVYYCCIHNDKVVHAFFVPEDYWTARHRVYEGGLPLAAVVAPMFSPTERSYCYVSRGDLLLAKTFLDRRGFRENLLFLAHINEYVT